jgi:hypothetical protein
MIGDRIVVLMPSDGLFDMEQFSLLSAPLSSARSSPAPAPFVVRGLGATQLLHPSSPIGPVERSRSIDANLAMRPSYSQADLGSTFSDSVPACESPLIVFSILFFAMCTNYDAYMHIVDERLMDVSFPSEIESSKPLHSRPTFHL